MLSSEAAQVLRCAADLIITGRERYQPITDAAYAVNSYFGYIRILNLATSVGINPADLHSVDDDRIIMMLEIAARLEGHDPPLADPDDIFV